MKILFRSSWQTVTDPVKRQKSLNLGLGNDFLEAASATGDSLWTRLSLILDNYAAASQALTASL